MYGFLVVLYSNFVPKTHHFWNIQLVSIQWPWNPGYGSLKVIGTNKDQSAAYDFLLMFYCNHEPISYHFQDKQLFQSKITNFSHPMYFRPPLKGFPLELGIGAGGQKLEWRATGPRKKFRRYLQLSGYKPPMWRTDTGQQQRLRLRIVSHGKKTRSTWRP